MSIEKFLQDKGIVKSKKQANSVMIGVIILCFMFIFWNMFSGKKQTAPQPLSPEEIEELKAMGMSDAEIEEMKTI